VKLRVSGAWNDNESIEFTMYQFRDVDDVSFPLGFWTNILEVII